MQEYNFNEHIKYETINGKLIYMAPASERHSSVVTNLSVIFGSYLKGKTCKVYTDNTYLHLDDLKSKDRLIPDIMVVCNRDIIKSDGIHGAPALIVEILSPSTAKKDKTVKKNIYEAIGVKEYWIIDAKSQSIDVYLLKDGKYELDNTYHSYSKEEIEMITEDETVEDKTIVTEFKTSLYDDLVISIDDVFDKLI